jgi:hypothetical protein
MSKVSFEKTVSETPTPADGVTVESVTTIAEVLTPAVIPATPQVIVVNTPSVPAVVDSPIAFDDSNIGFDDIILPRINIVQKVGDLSEIFSPGEIVLKQSLVIHSPGKNGQPGDPPLNITVLGFKKTQFAEKVVGGVMGILAHTEAEVCKHGGTLDYKEWDASEKAAKAGTGKALRYFQRLATALCLVEKPGKLVDEDHIEFPYECEGKFYALVLWSMKGTAYTHAAKAMFTARKIGHLRSGYAKQSWGLTSKMEKFGENFAAVPVVRPGAKNSEAFQAFVYEVIGLR